MLRGRRGILVVGAPCIIIRFRLVCALLQGSELLFDLVGVRLLLRTPRLLLR